MTWSHQGGANPEFFRQICFCCTWSQRKDDEREESLCNDQGALRRRDSSRDTWPFSPTHSSGSLKRDKVTSLHQAASRTLQAKGVAWPSQNTEREGLAPKILSRKVIIPIGRRSKCFPRHTKAEGVRPALDLPYRKC